MNARTIPHYKRLLLYGIGNQFKECYKLFSDKELILFDSNPAKWGQETKGHTIYSPAKMLEYINHDTGVIITSVNNQYEIATMLVKKIKIPSNILYMYTSEWYETKIYKSDTITENWDRISFLSTRFADKESQQYYKNAIVARQQRNPLLLTPNPKCVNIGEYSNIVRLQRGDTIIDCGAYVGDTAEIYMNRLSNECTVYAIEPYEENYGKLVEKITQKSWQDKVKAFHCAVGEQIYTTVLKYNHSDFGMAINLSNKAGKEQQTIAIETLDHLFNQQTISYIKMDIEGEEAKALRGAQKIIRDNHPRLMISGYHKIEDFWEIPEIIWTINSNYKIYVGHAPGVSTELEYYCIDQ